MAIPKTQGTYIFEDGFKTWVYGLSASEKKKLISKHGKVISFTRN